MAATRDDADYVWRLVTQHATFPGRDGANGRIIATAPGRSARTGGLPIARSRDKLPAETPQLRDT